MVDEGRPCGDVLVQIAAVRSALDRVGRILLEDHIESCILTSVETGDVEDQLADLKIALDRFIS
jgi:DNA-binding FrmR family transcriptional regulator